MTWFGTAPAKQPIDPIIIAPDRRKRFRAPHTKSCTEQRTHRVPSRPAAFFRFGTGRRLVPERLCEFEPQKRVVIFARERRRARRRRGRIGRAQTRIEVELVAGRWRRRGRFRLRSIVIRQDGPEKAEEDGGNNGSAER